MFCKINFKKSSQEPCTSEAVHDHLFDEDQGSISPFPLVVKIELKKMLKKNQHREGLHKWMLSLPNFVHISIHF